MNKLILTGMASLLLGCSDTQIGKDYRTNPQGDPIRQEILYEKGECVVSVVSSNRSPGQRNCADIAQQDICGGYFDRNDDGGFTTGVDEIMWRTPESGPAFYCVSGTKPIY